MGRVVASVNRMRECCDGERERGGREGQQRVRGRVRGHTILNELVRGTILN